MHWPDTPVERLQAFYPRFCPRPGCKEHLRHEPGYRFRRHASYRTKRGRFVPRFLCLTCLHSFSRQSFATSYYLKRPELLLPVAAGLQAGSAHRQIARSLGCAPSTVTRLSARLGRHGLLLLARCLTELRGHVREPIVIDHFETFEFSQDLPFGIATPIGQDSWFVYALDPAPHKRTGKLSPVQEKRLLERPRRPSMGGYSGSFTRILDLLDRQRVGARPLKLVCDGKPEYRLALLQHRAASSFRLQCHPNPPRGPKGSPPSPQARARDREMFASDALHALLRHTAAHHRRETIAFGRRLAAVMERMFLTAIWRNLVKGRSERKPDPTTPAMRLGLTRAPWSWQKVLSRRLFPSREELSEGWRELYRREWITPVLTSNTRHQRRHAF